MEHDWEVKSEWCRTYRCRRCGFGACHYSRPEGGTVFRFDTEIGIFGLTDESAVDCATAVAAKERHEASQLALAPLFARFEAVCWPAIKEAEARDQFEWTWGGIGIESGTTLTLVTRIDESLSIWLHTPDIGLYTYNPHDNVQPCLQLLSEVVENWGSFEAREWYVKYM